jgi:S-adenosylmethionine:tRNA-ribosyltransferase-isomerase (queuine synthetase)
LRSIHRRNAADRGSGLRRDGTIEHATFADLDRYLAPGDLLVLNNTRCFPPDFWVAGFPVAVSSSVVVEP